VVFVVLFFFEHLQEGQHGRGSVEGTGGMQRTRFRRAHALLQPGSGSRQRAAVLRAGQACSPAGHAILPQDCGHGCGNAGQLTLGDELRSGPLPTGGPDDIRRDRRLARGPGLDRQTEALAGSRNRRRTRRFAQPHGWLAQAALELGFGLVVAQQLRHAR